MNADVPCLGQAATGARRGDGGKHPRRGLVVVALAALCWIPIILVLC